jgi:hypothetical protein
MADKSLLLGVVVLATALLLGHDVAYARELTEANGVFTLPVMNYRNKSNSCIGSAMQVKTLRNL